MPLIRIYYLIGLLISANTAFAYQDVDFDQYPDLQKQLGLSEFDSLEILSFIDTEKIGWGTSEAWAMLKSIDSEEWYRAIPTWNRGEKMIVLLTPEHCKKDGDLSANAVIYINGTSVSAYSACLDSKKGLAFSYWAKTDKGKSFLTQEFRKNGLVQIRFNRRTIPFHTEGFGAAMKSLGSAPPL
jgi:hypothetical protein